MSLTGTGAQLFTWAYLAATAVLAIMSLSDSRAPALVFVVLGLYAAVGVVLTLDKGQQLSLPVAIAMVGVGPLSVFLLSWQLIPGGYTSWYVGATTVMLFFANLRGRILLAWIGCVLFDLGLLWWGLTSATGLAEAVLTATRQTAIVAIGTLTAVALERTSTRIRGLVSEASLRGAAEAAGLAVAEERTRRLTELRTSVVPILQRIASDSPISADDRREFAVAEADLRDSLRARGLRVPLIMEAARDARRRGVDVVLLDDSAGELTAPEITGFAAAVVDVLESASDGRVTARLLPPDRPVLGTIVADGTAYVSHEVVRGG
jgi:hypothetical protein